MQKSLLVGWGLLLPACYLGPDKHVATDRSEAGILASAADAATSETAAQGMQEDAAAVDAGVPDAGCTSNLACPLSAPACISGSCLPCTLHEECAHLPGTPACGPGGACVACTPDQKSACAPPTPACDVTQNACVECVDHADCALPDRASCSPRHECSPCSSDTECARFGKVCETSSGLCVQCRPTTEEADCRSDKSCDPATADCAGTACDPKRNVCTQTLRASLQVCSPCLTDSECAADHHCVPLFFGADAEREELGGFCMKLNASGCEEPFRAPAIEGRASLSGRTGEAYCGIDEMLTSCPAILALQADKDCLDGMATSCEAPGALCKTVNSGANKCTYSCLSNRDCIRGAPCRGPAGETHCGG